VQTKRYATIMAVMARETWTDERLDDLKGEMNERFNQVDKRLDRVEADIRELRGIMIGGFVTLLVALIGTSAL
jgi:23S rRNA C2498 (ribose-2'-O)-methylase RlmM